MLYSGAMEIIGRSRRFFGGRSRFKGALAGHTHKYILLCVSSGIFPQISNEKKFKWDDRGGRPLGLGAQASRGG